MSCFLDHHQLYRLSGTSTQDFRGFQIFFIYLPKTFSAVIRRIIGESSQFLLLLYTNYEHGWRPFKSLLLLGSFPLLAILPVFLQLTGVPPISVAKVSAIAGVHGLSVLLADAGVLVIVGRTAGGFVAAGVSTIACVHVVTIRLCGCWHSYNC